MGVVHLLEMIDVEDDERDRAAVAHGAGHLALEHLIEEALVVHVGQAIEDRQPIDLLVVGSLDVGAGEKLHHRFTEADDVAVIELAPLDELVVHEGAVGRAQVLDPPVVAAANEASVAARHGVDVEVEIEIGTTPHGVLGAQERVAPPRVGAGGVEDDEDRITDARELRLAAGGLEDGAGQRGVVVTLHVARRESLGKNRTRY
jgi:hypothetical protein